MNSYYFSQNAAINLLPYINDINFLYHINLFDWPISHTHMDYWEFTIITNGSIKNQIGGKYKTYTAGQVVVASTSDTHSLVAADNNPLRYITLMVKEEELKKVCAVIFGSFDVAKKTFYDGTSLTNTEIAEIEQILQNVDYSLSKYYAEYNELVSSAFLILMSVFIHNKNVTNLKIPSWQTKLNTLAQNTKLLTYNVTDLCEELGYSRTQLNYLFKKNYDISPHDYLINYKLNHAKQLLLNTNMSISDISYTIGYASPMQFYSIFKKVFGKTPSELKKSIYKK